MESNSELSRRKIVEKGHVQKNGAFAIAEQCNTKTTLKIRGEKVFMARESPLTTLMAESPHIRTVYNIFIAVLFLLLINTLLKDFVLFGKINVGLHRIKICFWSEESYGVHLWLLQFATALAAYPGFRLWAACWGAFTSKSSFAGHCVNTAGVMGYVTLQIMLIGVPTYSLFHAPLPIATGIAITLEMFRHLMKVHAFVRSCVGRAANPPPISCYIYFLFAPTLIYIDVYPRTNNIRWKKVLYYLIEMSCIIFFMAFIVDTFVIPCWADFGKEEVVAAETIVQHIFSHMVLGMISLLCTFYCLLHAWHNAAAELLTFADRLFYEEWWLSSRFGDYFRTWNLLVYDWLHAHVYREVAPRAGRKAALLTVFALSSTAHELIFSLTLGFFYPVQLIMFGVLGMIFVPLTSALGRRFPQLFNILMWMGHFMGTGLLWILYSMEYFARMNCPQNESDSWFIPKSWSCPVIKLNSDWSFKNPFT